SQFCNPSLASPFCIAVTSFFNFTHDIPKHDLYITLEVLRPHNWSDGWIAVGLGEHMVDALMFIVYGDPTDSSIPPVLSIRTTSDNHDSPHLAVFPPTINPSNPQADVQVVNSSWTRCTDLPWPEDGHTPTLAHIELICFSCDHWLGGKVLNLDAYSQPWIWAAHPEMKFHGDYAVDRDIIRHIPQGRSGVFYMNMNA
ncbi:hypothetical protein F5884DRAFT_653296, partial [Xylogone sp. PMI_703]